MKNVLQLAIEHGVEIRVSYVQRRNDDDEERRPVPRVDITVIKAESGAVELAMLAFAGEVPSTADADIAAMAAKMIARIEADDAYFAKRGIVRQSLSSKLQAMAEAEDDGA